MDNNYYYDMEPNNQGPKNNDKALISMICGITGLVFCLVGCICCVGYIGIPLSIIAIVLANMSKSDNNGELSGMAQAGFATGVIGLVVLLLGVLLGFCIGIFAGINSNI